MPPKVKVTREDIVNAAVELVRREGASALNARAIAAALGCSTQPIFSNFATMDELRTAAAAAADKRYQSYLAADMARGQYPPYKASGMAYIRFAREERELFRLLFMRDRSGEVIAEDRDSIRPLLTLIERNLGIDEDAAFRLHMELWIFVHGIATMIVTGYLNWDEAMVSGILTDAYMGLKARYTEGGAQDGSHSDGKAPQGV